MALFNISTKSGELRYGRDSKFQRLWYWLPPNGTGKRKVAVFTKGGTLFNPGNSGALTLENEAAEIADMLLNEFNMVIVSIDYRPGGLAIPEAQDKDRLFFPEVLEDFALCVQYLKGKAYDETIWGTGKFLSQDPNDWFRQGSSSGGWGAGYTQLQQDGVWPYSASGNIFSDEYIPRHNHLCNAVYLSIPQTVFSAFNKGAPGIGSYDSYLEYSWAGAYFFDSRQVVNPPSTPVWGYDQFPMSTKSKADFDENLHPSNPRCTDVGFYLTAPDFPGNIIWNISGNHVSGFEYAYWRGAYYPSGQNKPAPATGYFSLHDPWQCYWLYHRLNQLGNTKSRLRAGNSTSNPDSSTFSSLATTGDLRDWLTGSLGWIHP